MSSMEQPPKKRIKLTKTSSVQSFKSAFESALNSPSLADIIFCIPSNKKHDSPSKDEKKGADDAQEEEVFDIRTDSISQGNSNSERTNDLEYKEYSLNSFPFVVQSAVFKTMLIDNNKNRNDNSNASENDNNNSVKIVLKDLDVETFEFIRDYCYCLQPKLNKNIIFKALLSSIKYMIESMNEKCIEYLRNEWIIDRESLFSFLNELSEFENNINSNVISKQSILRIFNNNKILQRYACEFKNLEKIKNINSDILVLLLQCDSFHMNESNIWCMVDEYVKYVSFRDEAKHSGQLLSKFVPFIRFDIINLQFFLENIKPLLFEHNLMTKSQLCDILLSWNDKSLYQEKFTLKRQRFLFEENYLTSIDDIKIGDTVDCIMRSQRKTGFVGATICGIDKEGNTLGIKVFTWGGTQFLCEWENVVLAKPHSILNSHNERFANLQGGQLVQFRNVFECNDGDYDAWTNGKLLQDTSGHEGEVPIFECNNCNGNATWYICVNDSRCFRIGT